MTKLETTHFVLVDFENVPSIDLSLIDEMPVHVTLMIGKNQKKIDLALVHQIKRHAARVDLIEVGATGNNALDLTLAYYLGQAAQSAPDAQFHIVSKDKDFDPLVAHLRGNKIKVARYGSFAALPFLPQPKHPPSKKAAATKHQTEQILNTTADDKFDKLLARLKNNSAPRPKKRSRLLAHISTAYGNKLSEEELNFHLNALAKSGVLTIDAKDNVSYPTAPSDNGESP